MSKSLTPIIKQFGAKRLKGDGVTQRIQFSSSGQAQRAVWEISSSTGRQCWSSGDIVEVLK